LTSASNPAWNIRNRDYNNTAEGDPDT